LNTLESEAEYRQHLIVTSPCLVIVDERSTMSIHFQLLQKEKGQDKSVVKTTMTINLRNGVNKPNKTFNNKSNGQQRRRKPFHASNSSKSLVLISGLVFLAIFGLVQKSFTFTNYDDLAIHTSHSNNNVNSKIVFPLDKQTNFRLYHVMNIYATNKKGFNKKNGDPLLHQPYDQWVTLKSIEYAKKFLPNNIEMTLVCAILESDWEILNSSPKMVPVCDKKILLKRSTSTEYGGRPNRLNMATFGNSVFNITTDDHDQSLVESNIQEFFAHKELPFVQDVLDAATRVALEDNQKNPNMDSQFYVMMTNADIGLTKHFYPFLYHHLQEDLGAFQINRLTIPLVDEANITIREPTNDPSKIQTLLEQIHAARMIGRTHPGVDCFVIHSRILNKVQLGDQFAGYPAWAASLKLVLKDILSKGSYKTIESTPKGTFHLGDEKNWDTREKMIGGNMNPEQDFLFQNYQSDMNDCPLRRLKHIKTASVEVPNAPTLINLVNCGLAFRTHYQDFLREVDGGICDYNWNAGGFQEWTQSKEGVHVGCDAFRLGLAPYPWGAEASQQAIEKQPKRFNSEDDGETAEKMKQVFKDFNVDWDPNQPFGMYFDTVRDAMDTAESLGQPIYLQEGMARIIQQFEKFYVREDLEAHLELWNQKPSDDQTWNSFKRFWKDAIQFQKKIRRIRGKKITKR